ncbi:MAG: alpha-galactosidase [Lentisphaeria bacterium]
MSILFESKNRIFKLDTQDTTYVIQINPYNRICHLYYGAKISEFENLFQIYNFKNFSTPPSTTGELNSVSHDQLMQEYSGANTGDFRSTAIAIQTTNGAYAADYRYTSYKITNDTPSLTSLPCAFRADNPEVQTLEIHSIDPSTQTECILYYTVFPECNTIVRSVKLKNNGLKPVIIQKIFSAQLDLPDHHYDFINFFGSWGRERHPDRTPLHHGSQNVASLRGSSSHQNNPAIILAQPTTTETRGDAYGFVLAYSSNFIANVECDQSNSSRVLLGINPEMFAWNLTPGEEFETPQAFLTFSNQGLGQMSRNFHDFMRNHWISPRWSAVERPILINNWEATTFHFDAEKILNIAKSAAKLGIEMFVLDDGWFGHRDDDKSSLGDWFVYSKKISDMGKLVEQINALGLKFGLWFEPEMISEDSELYKTHPDWVLEIPGRKRSICRTQYMLDMSREDVIEYLFNSMAALLKNINIEYVKWDMNRNLTEVFSKILPANQQGEIFHRNVLGVYQLYSRLLQELPDLLIEGCASGGGRFDAGILRYSPQIWCSDDSDAIERLEIQGGTSFFYPPSSMGAHVSACPNHQTFRKCPFQTRGDVAFAGTFGYELDPGILSEDEQNQIKQQIKNYHQYHDLVANGDYFRLTNIFEHPNLEAWQFVRKDKSESIATVILRRNHPAHSPFILKLQGLNPKTLYAITTPSETIKLYGDTLMNAGIVLYDLPTYDHASLVLLLKKCK